jgi:hypothetical protein
MGFFCGMTVVLILVSFCCHLYEFIKAEDWQHSLRDLVLCNLKREVPPTLSSLPVLRTRIQIQLGQRIRQAKIFP